VNPILGIARVLNSLRKVVLLLAGRLFEGVLILSWIWSLAALLVYEPWPIGLRVPLSVAWVVGSLWAVVTLRRHTALRGNLLLAMAVVALAGVLVMRALWSLWSPSNDRPWRVEHGRPPTAQFLGNAVTVEHIRDFRYASEDDQVPAWDTRTYDLSALTSVDMCIVPFSWEGRGLAHTFLTFGFEDGEHLAISVEARREEGENYEVIPANFHQFELMYIVADERDVIGLRALYKDDPVYLYPLDVQPALAQALFVLMLQRANRLSREPEWYDLILNSCATNMVKHLQELYQADVKFTPHTLMPGYLDRVAAKLELIRADGDFEEVRDRYLVNLQDLKMSDDGAAWSRQIRTTLGQASAE
jgi:hypothetical protein